MKRKWYYILLLGLLFSGGTIQAQQYKVIEKSAKKAPGWYETAEADYLIASADEKDIETARQRCLESIRKQMIQAIAQNIEFSEKTYTKQTTTDSKISEFVESYIAEGSNNAASVPFLKGISLSKVEGSYWEKRRDKKSNAISYSYTIRYPFPQSELRALVAEFEKRDREMENKLGELEAHLNEVVSVEDIEQSINQLRPVVEYFFDKTRREKANGLMQSYQKLTSYISVEGDHAGGKSYSIYFLLQGRKITCATVPKLQSNCASQLKSSVNEDEVLITYDNSDCLEDEENYIEAVFRIPGKILKHKFYIQGSPQ